MGIGGRVLSGTGAYSKPATNSSHSSIVAIILFVFVSQVPIGANYLTTSGKILINLMEIGVSPQKE